jgi:hypothetical protein
MLLGVCIDVVLGCRFCGKWMREYLFVL